MISSEFMNGNLEMFCVFYVDMESSTSMTAGLRPGAYAFYYTAFYDTLSNIAQRHGGRVIKHIGDGLIIYFPATSDPTNAEAFKSTLNCGMEMLEAQAAMSRAFQEEDLPPLHYRISADYGRMEQIKTATSPTPDWIGPSMNMAAKMNRMADSNSMVIGGDLHQIITKLAIHEYLFGFAGELNIGIKQKYPVYSVVKKDGKTGANDRDKGIEKIVQTSKEGKMPEGSARYANVLIVDDESDVLLTYKRFLSRHPVNVETFSDPLQVLSRLAEMGPTYYDLAILDIRMPKLSGFQLYQILTTLRPNIEKLFVSALDYAGDVLSGFGGIDKDEDFIQKPVNRETFLCAVNRKIKLYA